jgi:hypothetical protein
MTLVDVEPTTLLIRKERLDVGSQAVEPHRFVEIREICDQVDLFVSSFGQRAFLGCRLTMPIWSKSRRCS